MQQNIHIELFNRDTPPDSVYIAAPYSGHPAVVKRRMGLVDMMFIHLRNSGVFVTSALLHHGSIFPAVSAELDTTGKEYWMAYSRLLVVSTVLGAQALLSGTAELWVLCLADWQSSEGVALEVETAKQNGMRVRYLYEYQYGFVEIAESAALALPSD